MTNLVDLSPSAAMRFPARVQPRSSVRFDWTATVLNGALVAGVYLDGWAHEHGRVDESFFTPWHGVLYGAMALVLVFLLATVVGNLLRGAAWRRALPIGYGLSLLGTVMFALGGVGDMIWHSLFGIEADLEALLSPTHLVLALGWFLIVGGPLRAAWQHAGDTPAARWPRWFALAYILSVFTFFTIYANPFGHLLAAPGEQAASASRIQALGITGFLLQPALLMGLVLLALRRWHLPLGSITLLLTLNTALVSVLHDQYPLIVVAAVAGLFADLLYVLLQPSPARSRAVRVFAFGVPVGLYTLYFGMLLLTTGIAWTVHLWTGAIVLSGVVGLLLSYIAVPPAVPAPATR